MPVTWHSVDLRTGARGPQVITDKQGTFGRIIGEVTDMSDLSVLIQNEDGSAVVDWEASTLPGRTMLVALDELEQPLWGGIVLRRRAASLHSPWVGLDMATCEAYFDRRYVKNHVYTDTEQGAIVEGIITNDVTPTGITFVVDADSEFLRDRTYVDDEDKTVLTVLTELMEVDQGAEWTVDLEWWDPEKTVLSRVLRVRDRIGTASTPPVARFELPGSVIDGEYVEDATSENLANDVMAHSSGEGAARPESSHAVATDLLADGWVKYEHRFEPSTSITTISVLDAHARAKLAVKRDGLAELKLKVRMDAGPRLGSDFNLGDDVTAVLTCARFPAQVGPDGDVVPGYTKNVRAVGWVANYDEGWYEPQLLEVG